MWLFFRKCDSFFKSPNLQNKNIPKNYPELEIWIFCLMLLAGSLNFKFRIVFWNISILEIGRFEKHIALSKKNPPLMRARLLNTVLLANSTKQLSKHTVQYLVWPACYQLIFPQYSRAAHSCFTTLASRSLSNINELTVSFAN